MYRKTLIIVALGTFAVSCNHGSSSHQDGPAPTAGPGPDDTKKPSGTDAPKGPTAPAKTPPDATPVDAKKDPTKGDKKTGDDLGTYAPTVGDKLSLLTVHSRTWANDAAEPATWTGDQNATQTVLYTYKAGLSCAAHVASELTVAGKPFTYERDIECKSTALACDTSCDDSGSDDKPADDIGMFKQAQVKHSWCVRVVQNAAGAWTKVRDDRLTFRHKDALAEDKIVGERAFQCTATAASEADARKLGDPCAEKASVTFVRSETGVVTAQTKGSGADAPLEFQQSGEYKAAAVTQDTLPVTCTYSPGVVAGGQTYGAGVTVSLTRAYCQDKTRLVDSLRLSSLDAAGGQSLPLKAGSVSLVVGVGAPGMQSYAAKTDGDCTADSLVTDQAKHSITGKLSCAQDLVQAADGKTMALAEASFTCVTPQNLPAP